MKVSSENVSYQDVFDAATRLLARREHSATELKRKLTLKGWPSALIDEAIANLQQQDWQSDERFLQSYVRQRLAQGDGPLKLAQQVLQNKGVDQQQWQQFLASCEIDWQQQCAEVVQRRFADNVPDSQKAWAKQVRFLQQRGFTQEQIFAVVQRPKNWS